MLIRRTEAGKKRSRHPEGTLGIDLRAHTLSLYPNLVLSLNEAQFLSGSTSRSTTRQARKLVLDANYDGAVRVVTEPGGTVSLAYEANDNLIYCMETTFRTASERFSFEENTGGNILKGTLESCLLDETGRIDPGVDVLQAFTLAVVAVNGWLALGKPLAFHEVRLAMINHELKIRPWRCEKPASVRFF